MTQFLHFVHELFPWYGWRRFWMNVLVFRLDRQSQKPKKARR